jgi:Flp pilus assembly protein TadG
MNIARRRFGGRQRFRGQQGQSLVETAIAMPLLLGLAFNILNWGYLWFMVLALSAAPRMGAQYATQGGAAGTGQAPGTTAVRDLVWENVTNAVHGATTATVAVQVCSSAAGLSGAGSSTIAQCDQFGPTFAFPTPAADPEAPVYVLDRVDVEYAVTPIIPGWVFSVVLPSNLKFHRQVSMRSLY